MSLMWKPMGNDSLVAVVETCDTSDTRKIAAYVTPFSDGQARYRVIAGPTVASGLRDDLVSALVAAEEWVRLEAHGARVRNL